MLAHLSPETTNVLHPSYPIWFTILNQLLLRLSRKREFINLEKEEIEHHYDADDNYLGYMKWDGYLSPYCTALIINQRELLLCLNMRVPHPLSVFARFNEYVFDETRKMYYLANRRGPDKVVFTDTEIPERYLGLINVKMASAYQDFA